MDREEIGIDTALQRSIGEFGRGQQIFYCLAQFAWVSAALQTLVMVFTGLDPVVQRWFSCSEGPHREACEAVLNSTKSDPSEDFCKLPVDAYTWTRRGDSIVSEWNLVCADHWKQQAVNSGFFGGFLVGAGLFGVLSDKLGRKRALLVSLLVGGVSGVLGGLSPSYWAYFFWRFLCGVGVAGIGMVAYVLGCEYVGPTWRGFLGVAAQYFFAIGATILPAVAFFVPNWRTLSFITGGCSILYILVLPSLPESPRWLLISGRKGDATATLAAIASYNGTHLPDVPLADIVTASGSASGMSGVLFHRTLRNRLLVQLLAWFSVSSMYYGISLMVADLPGSVYANNAILAVVELPAYFVASMLVERIGRRWTIAPSYVIAGTCLILSAGTKGPVSLWLAFMAKCCAAAAFAIIILFAAELFPTVVRNVCIGASSQAARIGGILTPVIIIVAHAMHFPLFAFLVMGLLSLVAGIMLFTQPETLGSVLPETIQVGAPPERARSGRRPPFGAWMGARDGLREGGTEGEAAALGPSPLFLRPRPLLPSLCPGFSPVLHSFCPPFPPLLRPSLPLYVPVCVEAERAVGGGVRTSERGGPPSRCWWLSASPSADPLPEAILFSSEKHRRLRPPLLEPCDAIWYLPLPLPSRRSVSSSCEDGGGAQAENPEGPFRAIEMSE
eukprot:CAMPEP_0177600314 /NCGR_PEP_ID=MMETSP0419_2-20121207/13552_1 /TAXON_ID=582737 /ORGANISM="Tetraselmis sp., Strain GSL018" /LENGTH=670 /DNA_ID=CAMNT_0019093289 /DNA_START=328 /DNA_END=2340 /DNA_ORIENTATION=+